MKNGGKNTSVAFIILFSVYIYMKQWTNDLIVRFVLCGVLFCRSLLFTYLPVSTLFIFGFIGLLK